MEFDHSSAYDNDIFFSNYLKRRHRENSPNITIELPIFLELIGDVNAKKVLDLGCGDASLGKLLLDLGCSFYMGIDGSVNMIHHASNQLKNRDAKLTLTTMQEYEYPEDAYDIVVSQLAFQYINDFDILCKKMYKTMKPSGQLIFSIQHPLLTSSFKSMTNTGRRENWIVDDYFRTGKRIEPWIGEKVVKYHRTIEDYYSILQNTGFMIESLREAKPRPEFFNEQEEYERRLRIPLFLLFKCKKQG